VRFLFLLLAHLYWLAHGRPALLKSSLIFLLLLGGAYALLVAFTFIARSFLPKQKAEAAAFWTWASIVAIGAVWLGGSVSPDLLGRRF
jgi:hypothetical protein